MTLMNQRPRMEPRERAGAPAEYRQDPVTGRWVILAPGRSARPQVFAPAAALTGGPCPFCEGREIETPPEIAAHRSAASAPNDRGWQVRVVPNRYPAFTQQGGFAPAGSPLWRTAPGAGIHEVIIESPHHLTRVGEMTDAGMEEILHVYRERLRSLAGLPDVAYAMIFKNVGAAAGASLAHVHSQLMATPIVPTEVALELAGAGEYRRRHGSCVFCDLAAATVDDGRRLIASSRRFLAMAPFASRVAYEAWILPQTHLSRFEALDDDDLRELAPLLREVLSSVESLLPQPAYNVLLHTAPFGAAVDYHWHWEILPRLATPAGFEWGTGMFVNTITPEDAADRLRSSKFPKVC